MVAAICLLDCTSSFDQLTTQGPCPESNLLLECSAERTLLTVFRGSLLNCSNTNNEITLLHSRFNTTSGTNGTCNNGRILGYSLPDNTSSNCYISQLCITVTPDIIGKTIECAYDNGTTEIIGSYLIGETQCYTTTFTTITPSTGKFLIHVGLLSLCLLKTVLILCITLVPLQTVHKNSTSTCAYTHYMYKGIQCTCMVYQLSYFLSYKHI